MQSVPITTKVLNSNPASGEVYTIQRYVIKFFSDLWQVGGFLWVLRFPPPVKWPPRYSWNIVESGIKYHNPVPLTQVSLQFHLTNKTDGHNVIEICCWKWGITLTLYQLHVLCIKTQSIFIFSIYQIFVFLAAIPVPILFGKIIDTTCLIWSSSNNRRGACALYNIEDFRFRMIGVVMLYKMVALLFSFLSLKLVWNITDWNDLTKERSTRDTEEKLKLVVIKGSDQGDKVRSVVW